jgi:predicted alpha/beta-fold hydrolase
LYFLRKIRGSRSPTLITILLLAVIVTLPAVMTTITSTTTNRVYGQQPDQMDLNVTDSSVNIQNSSEEKIVQVGDIEIAYKMSGNGEPILLISGGSADKNAWDPSFISDLSSNHTVIVFDNRGVGNTTIGSQPYTIEQLANDTAGLLDALKIQNANVLGYSLGSWIAEQLTIT